MSSPDHPTGEAPEAAFIRSSDVGPLQDAATPSAGRAPRAVVFPPSITDAPPSPWRRRFLGAGAAVAVVILVAGIAFARSADSSTVRYRSAAVGNHDVETVLTGVASIEPVTQAAAAFPVGGTVSSLYVAVGESVAVGQVLATIDPEALVATLHQNEASLAAAQLTLSQAVSGGTVASTSSSTGGTSSARSNAGSASTRASTQGATGSAEIAAAQQAVIAGQKDVDSAMAASDQALASSTQVCAVVTGAHGSPAGSAATATTPGATPSTTPAGAITACQQALDTAGQAQASVSSAQSSLAAASSALDDLLARQASSATTPTTASTAASSSSAQSAQSGGSGSSFGTSSSDLIADQKAVDAAAAEVAAAEQAVAQAVIVSPITGTVAAVNLPVGDTVTAASSTANIVIVGPGGLEVTTTVSIDQVPDVRLGQPATVLPDGATDPIPGQVIAIFQTPASTSGGTTYRVTIGLDGGNTDLGNGATGSVRITTARAASVPAVPTSAVHTDGTNHTVTVLDHGKASTASVRVGVIGSTWTQIADGVSAGQIVVLANLDQALPGSATSSTNGQTTTSTNADRFTRGFGPGAGGAPPAPGGGG